MMDMNKEVAAVLKDICTVQLAFPEVSITSSDDSIFEVTIG